MRSELIRLLKFYKGEKECPYDSETQRDQSMFWFYEWKFNHLFFESEVYKGKLIEQALSEYLQELFPALSDKYGAMDDGTWFKDLYERLEP